jgi:hypothetical protein
MNTPERSAAIARALAPEKDGLPEDFAAQVAALAEAQSARRWSWSDVTLLGAFVAMVGVCVVGWSSFGAPEFASIDWLGSIVRAAASYPWLAAGVAGVGVVQMLNFRRRLNETT